MPEVIVALDVATSKELPAILDQMPEEIRWYKLGLELFCAEGPAALAPIKERGKKIFLDLKLHDIPRTVERAVQAAAQHGVDLLTIHAVGGKAMMEAAANMAKSLGEQAPKLIAVTTLTSLNETDFKDLGIERSLSEQAVALADVALQAGIDGLVTSVLEVTALRDRFGADPLLVTPGIRLPSDDVGDQKRVATPGMAAKAGASYLVVGRTILAAEDPHAAAQAVLKNMKNH